MFKLVFVYKYFYLILFITLLATSSYGQYEDISLSERDSLALISTWARFKKSLASNDKFTIRQLSLNRVACAAWYGPNQSIESPHFNPYMSPNEFSTKFYKKEVLKRSKLWSIMKKDTLKALRAYLSKPKKNSASSVYGEIWYYPSKYNRKPNSWEGTQIGFVFVKVNDRFKFEGMNSIP